MRLVAAKLLITQVLIALTLTSFSLLLYQLEFSLAVFAGATLSIISTLLIYLITRKLPTVIRAKDFYLLMWVCEIIKWLAIILFTVIFLRIQLSPLGLIMGFIPSYLGGYCLMMKLK